MERFVELAREEYLKAKHATDLKTNEDRTAKNLVPVLACMFMPARARVHAMPMLMSQDGSAVEPAKYRAAVRADKKMMSWMKKNDPDMREIIMGGDDEALQALPCPCPRPCPYFRPTSMNMEVERARTCRKHSRSMMP